MRAVPPASGAGAGPGTRPVSRLLFPQHLQEQLDLDLSPLEYMMKCYPDIKEKEEMRKIIGRYGLTGKQQVRPGKGEPSCSKCSISSALRLAGGSLLHPEPVPWAGAGAGAEGRRAFDCWADAGPGGRQLLFWQGMREGPRWPSACAHLGVGKKGLDG